jgi:hypothetical protein
MPIKGILFQLFSAVSFILESISSKVCLTGQELLLKAMTQEEE